MFLPCFSVCCIVEDQRLEAVHASRELRFGCFLFFEFEPEGFQIIALVFRKDAVDLVGSLCFALRLSLLAFFIVSICIACIDFDEVVNKEHRHGLQYVYFFIRILFQ